MRTFLFVSKYLDGFRMGTKLASMLNGKRLVVVMPAFNAERTLKKTYDNIPHEVVDEIILTDDRSSDRTAELSSLLGISTFRHDRNRGSGANQKTCYGHALRAGADVVVMLHPDYQYDPKLITALASLVAEDIYDAVIGSRVLVKGALKGGMPVYKYLSNRFLTFYQNFLTGHKLSEYHTGYRSFSRRVLTELPLLENSDDFVFDNQMLLQVLHFGFRLGEISSPARYEEDSSTINFRRSLRYGSGCLRAGLAYRTSKWGILRPRIFRGNGLRLNPTR